MLNDLGFRYRLFLLFFGPFLYLFLKTLIPSGLLIFHVGLFSNILSGVDPNPKVMKDPRLGNRSTQLLPDRHPHEVIAVINVSRGKVGHSHLKRH